VRLKRLELSGFKTFADRTVIEFASQITGIVGPNGSGKSNIFDAIRWALGEGSLRALRGIRTEDIIFAGTERRRPLGMAEVTLTIDNEDGTLALPQGPDGDGAPPSPLVFAEVTVTRRAMRSAESQYFINGIACRLRDIQTMFLGTGLGGHTYALITQGEVEEMLDATPEERRMILEEAAGLAKYKRRRHDAERRMGAAEATLLRVADILGELEAQTAQLAAQAEAAEQYQAQTRELRTLELALQVEEVRRCTRAQRRVREQLEEVVARRRETDEAMGALAQEGAGIDRLAADSGQEWEELQRARVGLVEQRAAADSAVQLVAERTRGVEAQRARAQRDLDRLQTEREQLHRERAALADAEGDLAIQEGRARADLETAQGTLGELEAEARRGEDHLDAGRNEARALVDARSRAWNEMAAAEAREAAHRDQGTALSGRIAHVEQQVDAARAQGSVLAGERAGAEAGLQELRDRLSALRAEAADHVASREKLLASERQLEIERERSASRLRYLEEAQSQYRGYESGARGILLAWQNDPAGFRGLRGAVADFLSVPRHLRAAVEAALGTALSALVVDSVEDARAAVSRLGEAEPGGVAFVVTSAVENRGSPPLPQAAASDPEILGSAADLVQIVGHPQAIRALLEDVLVVENLDAAIRVRGEGYRGRVVSLAGDALAPEGVLTLGRRPSDMPGVLGRTEEIAELRATLERVETSLDQIGRRKEDVGTRISEIEDAALRAETSVDRQADLLAEYRRRVTLFEAEIERLQGEANRLATEKAAADQEASAKAADRERLGSEAEAIGARLAEVEARIGALSTHLRGQAEARREAASRVTDLRVELTGLGGKREALRTQVIDAERALAQSLERTGELDDEMGRLAAETARLDADRIDAGARCDALDQEGARLAAAQAALDTTRADLAARRTSLEARHQEVQAQAAALADDAHRLEVRQAQVEAELGGARRRMEEEFGIPFERAVDTVPETVHREETLGRIEALRGLIAALGPVNLLAIEEHRQVAARAQALRVHMEDTQMAVAALRVLIQYLEEVIREQFDKTYRAVHEEFAALFVRLFGGGRAGLELVTVADGAEPGIDIIAQPPGKKLRSLGALSGGERVMVALALAFAMLRVRPSPFCVFDEVEAALDEANTRKVTGVLRELAARTQIIVITHNKATMEASDVLFGVTMEESGVSRLVSMRLVSPDQPGEPQPVG